MFLWMACNRTLWNSPLTLFFLLTFRTYWVVWKSQNGKRIRKFCCDTVYLTTRRFVINSTRKISLHLHDDRSERIWWHICNRSGVFSDFNEYFKFTCLLFLVCYTNTLPPTKKEKKKKKKEQDYLPLSHGSLTARPVTKFERKKIIQLLETTTVCCSWTM